MPTLNVYLHGQKVGTLSSDEGQLSFCYDQEYCTLVNPEPLSFSLPVRIETFSEEAIVPFFSKRIAPETVSLISRFMPCSGIPPGA